MYSGLGYLNNHTSSKAVDPDIHKSTHNDLNPKRGSQEVVIQMTNPTHMRLTVRLEEILTIVKRN
jgi:hypothetical protein